MALYHSPRIITNGLVLYLDAANTKSYPGSGTTWTDLSGNGNNANFRNWASLNLSTISNVKCFYLNGSTASNGDIEIPSFYGNYVAGDNTHTFEWWGYCNTTSIDVFNSGSCGSVCIAYGESGSYFDATGTLGISAGIVTSEWHHYVLIQNGTRATSYRDGVQIDTRNDWGVPGAGSLPGVIGSRSWANRTNNWYLASMKWYNRVLSVTEIQQNYQAMRGRFGI